MADNNLPLVSGSIHVPVPKPRPKFIEQSAKQQYNNETNVVLSPVSKNCTSSTSPGRHEQGVGGDKAVTHKESTVSDCFHNRVSTPPPSTSKLNEQDTANEQVFDHHLS